MSRHSTILPRRAAVAPDEGGPAGPDDVSLFRRFLGGDDRAFMELFNRHASRLYIYCQKIVGDPHAAHDIMQDVWERVIRFRAAGKEVPRSPLGLLITTTRNLCLNFKRDRREHLSIDQLGDWRGAESGGGEMSEMEEAVLMALDRLPMDQREVLILNAYAGYRYEEIAEMVGETVGAVRTRAWRARAKLGRIIAALLGLQEGTEGSSLSNENES